MASGRAFRAVAVVEDAVARRLDLRRFGEGSALAARPRHFTRRAIFDRADQIYRAGFGRKDGLIPATFEMIALTGWAPHDSQQKPLRPGSAAARLADVLNTELMIRDAKDS